MRRSLILFAGLFSLSLVVHGEKTEKAQVLSRYQIEGLSETQMQKISDNFEIEEKTKTGFKIIVPSAEVQTLKSIAPDARLVTANIESDLSHLRLFNLAANNYHTLAQVHQKMEAWAAQHPDIAQLVDYGKSTQGRRLVALKLSDNVTQDELEPELMLTSATHGDEIITTEILLGLMDQLIAGYGVDSRLTKMVQDHELYFIPVINADGFASRSRYDNGVDPNRAYPYPEKPDVESTTTIKNLIGFFHSREFAGSIDFHAQGGMVMYPWAYTYDPLPEPDRTRFDDLAKKMAQDNRYVYGPISEVIYVAKGSSADYYYWQKKTLAYGIEVGRSKAPSPSQIPAYIEEQRELLWKFIENF